MSQLSRPRKTTSALMPIGEFSRRSRLSLKALRLYDELGVLPPAETDGSTGYRYYAERQLAQARLIGLLRQLGMPLDRISVVLDAPPDRQTEEIRRYWIELEGSMAVRHRIVAYLESFLAGRGEVMYEVRTRNVPAQQILSVTRSVRQPQLIDFLMEWMPGLAAILDRAGVRHTIHTFVIYHGEVNDDSDGPVEICMAFEGTIDVPEGLTVRTEPAHEEAYATISKAQCRFPEILQAYDAVASAIKEHGWEMAASPREVYFVDIDAIGDDDPFVDIAWPMTRAPERATAPAPVRK